MQDTNKETELGFHQKTSLKDLKRRGVGTPMVSYSREIVAPISTPSKHSLSSLVKVSDLMIDYSYQREQSKYKVAKIARNFNYDALGVIIISIRESGEMFILDGGHRVAAMNLLGKENETIDALVYFDLTVEQEADLFVKLNEDRTKPKRSDIFDAKVASRDASALEISSVLDSLGLRISSTPGNGNIRAVSGINQIFENAGPDVMKRVLYVTKEAFGNHSSSFNKEFIVSMSMLYHHCDSQISDTRMIEKLKKFVNPNNIVSLVRTNMKLNVFKDTHIGIIHVVVSDYNKSLRKNGIDTSVVSQINPSKPWTK